MKWNLGELRQHVRRLFGEDHLRIVNQCLRTIGDRREFSRYHFNAAKSRIEENLHGRENFELTAALLGAFDTSEWQFSTARFEAYAHTVACVQSMHAVVDNMIHFVYYALGSNLDASSRIERERDITWSKVSTNLGPGPIKDGLKALLDDPGFTYLAAVNNHSKHRSIIDVSYSVDFASDAVEHGLLFSPFSYDGVDYPAKWVRPTLINEYQRQEAILFAIGNAVNDTLREQT